MGIIDEFKQFAVKGSVIDLAVGVVIGGAFGKIVSSLVADIIMPPIGLIVGGVNFTGLKLTLKSAAGPDSVPVTLNYGTFLQNVFDFLIVAWAIFLFVKAINRLRRKEEAAPAAPPKQEVLLTEIRDILKSKSAS